MKFNREDFKDEEILSKVKNRFYKNDYKPEFNWSCFTEWLDGATYEYIAEKHNKSDKRISQIISKMCRRYNFIKELIQSTNDSVISPTDIRCQDFSPRTFNALWRACIDDLTQFSDMTEEDLRNIRCVGKQSAEEILNKLKEHNIELLVEKDDTTDEGITSVSSEDDNPTTLPEEEESTPISTTRFCDQSFLTDNFDISNEFTPYIQMDDSPLEESVKKFKLPEGKNIVEAYNVVKEWTYECSLFKVYTEKQKSLEELYNNSVIIMRDFRHDCGRIIGDVHSSTAITKINSEIVFMQNEFEYVQDKLESIPEFSVYLPMKTLKNPITGEIFTDVMRDIANINSFNVKFLYVEELMSPVIYLPKNMTVLKLEQVCDDIKKKWPVVSFANKPNF